MGEVNKHDIYNIINRTYAELLKYVDDIEKLDRDSLVFILILLSQCMYAMYCSNGKDCGCKYIVYAEDLEKGITNKSFSIY